MNDQLSPNNDSDIDPSSDFPRLSITEAPHGFLCLSELNSDGATVTVKPWEGIVPGQRFWLSIGRYPTPPEQSPVPILDIYSGEPLTSDEAINGISRKITSQQLASLPEIRTLLLMLKISLNGSENEEDATIFPHRDVTAIKKLFDKTNFTGNLNDWKQGADFNAEDLTHIEVDSNYLLRYTQTDIVEKVEKTILYKDFKGLIPNRNYALVICTHDLPPNHTGNIGVSTNDGPIDYKSVAGHFWTVHKFNNLSITSASTQIRISIRTHTHSHTSFDMDDITLFMEELPIPEISHTQTNLLFLNTVGSEGITFNIAPWGSLPGQKVWLTAYHDRIPYPLLKAHPLTDDEAENGLSVVFHPEDLLSLSNHTPLTFILDITEDGSVAKNEATTFKVLTPKLITDFVSRTTFTAGNLDHWVVERPGPDSSVDIINEDNHFFVRTIEAGAHGDTPILSKSFTGLSPHHLYKLVVPMRRVDLKTNAPRFSIQLSTGEFKEIFTLTNMEWTDYTCSLNVPQANIRFQIVSLDTRHGGNIYDIDDICLIKVDPL
ncbi:hypothetical protein KW846_06420 [Pseudomonas sp. PDM32]|uniref:hypothetical protein n=1 Tax=Pseudomonas sp. PDM32 TaxID=2854768 RepID=UPI001C48A088|nr:hypothetical protein [Pseudomonas sp. PDM32]MBV7572322.1 hypothetical protein [Pseudomonas sp. PDM32]